jgi:lysophospholipase L1-like esterase
MQEDPHYEYIAQPSQHRFRFRNHVSYNAYSMRSPEVDSSATTILGFGDSIINGGVQTDDDSLATTILSDSLTGLWGRKTQFLNISAGSWAPDNNFAYLQKHGTFGSRNFFLFVSSHDAYDNMTFDKTVDVNVSFPSKQYSLALYELFDRYLIPRLKARWETKPEPVTDNLAINKQTDSSVFNPGFAAFAEYAKEKGINLTIYLHAEQSELRAGEYNEQGKKIIAFAEAAGLPLIKDLEHGLAIEDFRDDIHINEKGQRKLAGTVLDYIRKWGLK